MLEHILKLLGVARQGVFEFVQVAEVVDFAVISLVVKGLDNGMVAGIAGGIFVQELQVVAAVGHQGQRHRLDFGIVHAVGDGAKRAVEFTHVVALVHLLDRQRVVVGVDALRLIRRLYNRGLGGELLHLGHRFHEQVVLPRQLQAHLRRGHIARVVDDKALVLVGDLLCYGNIGNAHRGHLVVPEDVGILCILALNHLVDGRHLLVILLVADEVHEEGHDGQQPFPGVATFLFNLLLVLHELIDLLLEGLLLPHNAFGSLCVVVEEEPGLILVDVARVFEDFSCFCHKVYCLLRL